MARLRRQTVTAMLVVAALDAAALVVAALAGAEGGGGWNRHVAVGLVLLALNVTPLAAPGDVIELLLGARRWVLLPFAALSGAMLWLDGPGQSVFLPAALTPVGVAAMFGYRGEALLASIFVIGGFAAGALGGGSSGPLELFISDTLTVVGLLLAVLAAVRIGMSTTNDAGSIIDAVYLDPQIAERPAPLGSPSDWAAAHRSPAGERRERIAREIRQMLREGMPYTAMALEIKTRLGLELSVEDVRYQVRKLRWETAQTLGLPEMSRLQLTAHLRQADEPAETAQEESRE